MAYLDYDGLSTVRNLIDNLYVRADKFNDDVRERIDYELDPIDGSIHWCTSIAADETAKTAWEGMLSSLPETVKTANVITPDRFTGLALIFYIQILIDHRANLVWMNGSELEFSTLQASINTQTNTIIVYACGRSTMAYGVAGVDDSWTIEELPDDTTYELPPATTSTLGGVKVGNGLSVAADGTLSSDLDYAASPISGGNAVRANGILYAAVDSTSTSTNFTATVDGLTELYDGACVMLHNGVVTSAKDFTVNVNGLGAKKCYSNMTNATQETTIFNVAYTLMFVYSTALDNGNGGWWIYRGYDSDESLVLLEYGKSTWANFKSAYDAKRIVYCRVPYGSGSRLAFMAWYESSKVEFQYYRSVNGHTAAQQSDEVYVYTLTSGNKWTTTVRQTNARVVAGSGLSSTYANDVLTINADGSSYELPPATASTLGGVKVGDGLSVESDGTLSANGIADGSVTTAKLANGAVTSDKLDSLAVAQRNIKQDAVGNHQLADDAVHTDNILDGAVTIDKIDGNAKRELVSDILYATDATTAQTLAALGFTVTVLTPKDAYSTTDAYGTSIQMSTRSMLCWIDTASGYLEKAPIGFSGNLQSQTITLWAKGLYSKATGTLGVDTSWTITALPTDADGVSY